MIPIVEQIAQALVARLETVSVAGGYETDVARVARPTKTGGYPLEDRLVVLLQDDPAEDADLEGAGSLKAWVQPFRILCFVLPSDTETTPVDTRINTLRADVEKAVRVDPTLGGLATDAVIRAPEGWTVRDTAFEGVTVNVDVHYRTAEDDPYAQGG